jgi:hypothetical protein
MNTSTFHKTSHRISGAGGAHFGLFGRPRVCMAPEGDGTGSGGGNAAPGSATGAGDGSSTTTTAGTPPPAATPPGERLFTQAELDRHVQERLARAQRSQPQQPAPSANPTNAELAAELASLRARTEFNDLIADHQIPRSAQGDMFDLYRAQRPADPAAWVAGKAPMFKGPGTTTTTPPSTPVSANPADPASLSPPNAPAAAPNAPAAHTAPITTNGLTNIYELTPEQFARYTPAQLRAHHESNVAAAVTSTGAPPIRRPPRKA